MKLTIKLTLILFFLFLLTTNDHRLSTTYAEVPNTINYQGKLTDQHGDPLNETCSITFSIYDQVSGGNNLFSTTKSVAVDQGIFNVQLQPDLPFDTQYYLGTKVGSDEEMSPRQKLATAAYSFRSRETDALPNGIIVMWSGRISDIPSGWVLCDGTNNTPNLKDRFIIGASQDSSGMAQTTISGSSTRTGGATTHTHPAGSLSVPQSTSSHAVVRNDYANVAVAVKEHTHSISGKTASGSSLPPYYALAYIMKQ